ncbi:MAG: WD40 repeat domain-containing protein [Deltaproteobacteria bacterium]|nr:WD40 repeat domain-containing protein [Deltaproteobacteria bacterium]
MRSVAYSPNGSMLASASGGELEFGDVSLWDVESGQSEVVFGRYMGGVHVVTFSADGTLVASASDDEGVLLWSVDDGTLLNSFKEGTHISYAVAFSPDGRSLASAGNDGGGGLYTKRGKVHIWDVPSGEILHTFELSDTPLYTVAFSPDGTMLAAAGDDHLIHLVDLHLYEEVYTFKGHAGRINSIAFSSNGQLIASGSDDRYLKIWSVGDLVGETCADGIDNDGDGWLDAKDPDCADGEREIGFGETECNDGMDNDHDGYEDAADPECLDGSDDSEAYLEDMDAGPDGGDETDAGTDSGDDDDDAGMDGGTLDAGNLPDAGGLDSGVLDGGESDGGY